MHTQAHTHWHWHFIQTQTHTLGHKTCTYVYEQSCVSTSSIAAACPQPFMYLSLAPSLLRYYFVLSSLFLPSFLSFFSSLLSPTVVKPCIQCVCVGASVQTCCLYVHLPGQWLCHRSMTVTGRFAISTWVLSLTHTNKHTLAQALSLTLSTQWHATTKPNVTVLSPLIPFPLFVFPVIAVSWMRWIFQAWSSTKPWESSRPMFVFREKRRKWRDSSKPLGETVNSLTTRPHWLTGSGFTF